MGRRTEKASTGRCAGIFTGFAWITLPVLLAAALAAPLAAAQGEPWADDPAVQAVLAHRKIGIED